MAFYLSHAYLEIFVYSMHTWHIHFFTHSELLGPILGSVETREVEVDLWSCWVFNSLDDNEASSRIFLFDDTLSLVVPTATMFDIKEDDISRNH